MPDIVTLGRYAAANGDGDQAILTLCMNAAQAWLGNAGVAPREGDSLYDLAAYMLATYFYDNRGAIAENGFGELPMGVMGIVHQLRLETGEPTATGDGGTIGGGSREGE